jgi:hypothetical protein
VSTEPVRRERWFYAQDNERRGPVVRDELLKTLLTAPEPRSCLVWRRGLVAWTRAGDVPDLRGQLPAEAPPPETGRFAVPTRAAMAAARAAERAAEPDFDATIPAAPIEARGRIAPVVRVPEKDRPFMAQPAVWVPAAAVILLALGVGGWALLKKPAPVETPAATTTGPQPIEPRPAPSGANPAPGRPSQASRPAETEVQAVEIPATPRTPPPEGPGWADRETELPPVELQKLRGVAGWQGNKLVVTLYNGSGWRVTEIFVMTSKWVDDQFVDAERASRLLPVSAPMDASVGDLLKKVAPDRKKPGVNPLDAGPFEVEVGPQPEAYRWKIQAARGYPPR